MARSSAIVAFVLLSAMLVTGADEDFENQWGRDFLKGATKALEQIAENAKNSIEDTKDEKESFPSPDGVKPSSNDDPSFFVMDDVMEMLFHTSENVSHPYEPEYAAAEDAFKSGATDYWAELEKKMDVFSGHAESWWPISDNALEKIDKILASNGNATFDIVNGEIVFDHVSDDAIENNTVTSDVTGQQEDLMMTKKNSIPTTSHGPTSSFNITTVSPYGTQLSFYQEIVDEGYLDQKSLDYFKSGIISEEELNHQLLTNKTYVLAQFRPIFAKMLEEKDHRIPEEVHIVLFSGKLPLSELKWVVYENGAISKALLPESLRQMLETRDPPHEVKEMLYDGYNDTQIMRRVMGNATILQKVMSASMYYMYTIFRQPQKRAINVALSAVAIVVLFFVMTSLGCTMTVAEIMRHVRRPKGVIIALVSQYGIMPAAAFGLTQIFHLDTYPAIAILICGCCPGGNLSNMLAFAINGDMNLSILMTTCSSVLGLGMMPLLLYCYSRFIIPIDGAELVPFDKIILNVALTIIPVSIGIAIKHYRPHWTKNVMRVGGE